MSATRFLLTLCILGLACGTPAGPAASQSQDLRNDATDATKAANAELLRALPFDDTSDFDNARRGLIAPLPSAMLEGQSGNAIWNPHRYSSLTPDGEAPDTATPSLWRQSTLTNIGSQFEVPTGLYP